MSIEIKHAQREVGSHMEGAVPRDVCPGIFYRWCVHRLQSSGCHLLSRKNLVSTATEKSAGSLLI